MTAVHLRFCRVPAPGESCRSDVLAGVLSAPERDRCARLPRPQAARAVVARALLRTEVAAVLGLEADRLAFVAGPHGKPAVFDPPQPIAFNLSHSVDWVVLAWHTAPDSAPLGVDLEHPTGQRDVMRLARRYFAVAEQAALRDLHGDDRDTLFYRLWTLKEAWVKAHGLALAPQLKAVAFDLGRERPRVSNETALATGRMLHGEVAAGVWTSLCVLDSGRNPLTVDARIGLPLGDWSPLTLQGCWSAPPAA